MPYHAFACRCQKQDASKLHTSQVGVGEKDESHFLLMALAEARTSILSSLTFISSHKQHRTTQISPQLIAVATVNPDSVVGQVESTIAIADLEAKQGRVYTDAEEALAGEWLT